MSDPSSTNIATKAAAAPAGVKRPTAKRPTAKRAPVKRPAGAAPVKGAAAKRPAGATPVKRAVAKRPAGAAPVKRAVSRRPAGAAPAKRAPVKRAVAKRPAGAAPVKRAPVKRAVSRRPAASTPVRAEEAVERGVVIATATAQSRAPRKLSRHLPPPSPRITLPVTGWTFTLPPRREWPWIGGVVLVAALDIVDWPVALIIAIGHTILTNSHNEQLRELADGIETAL